MRKTVIVIGAGIAGLTAAYRLQQQGFEVSVVEATERPGGRMSTDIEDGHVADRGAQFLVQSYKTLMPLIEELGLSSELVPTMPYSAVYMNKKIVRLRHEFAHSRALFLLKSMGSLSAFIKGLWSGIPLLLNTRLRKDDYTAWQKYDDSDGAQWFKQDFNERALDYSMEPLLEGFFFHPPEHNSSAMARNLLAFNLSKGKIMTMKKGLGSVTEALAARLNVAYNQKVIRLSKTETGVEVRTSDQVVQADYAVLAVPAPIAKGIYAPHSTVEQCLLNTKYSSTLLVTIATQKNWSREQKALRGVYGVLIPRKERGLVCAVGIETSKHKSHTTAGELMNIMTEGLKTHQLIELSDEEIIAKLLPELEDIFPGVSGSIVYTRVVRWRYAQTLSPVGRSRNIATYRQQISAAMPIAFAGDYMGIGATDSAAHTGEWAAQAICADAHR